MNSPKQLMPVVVISTFVVALAVGSRFISPIVTAAGLLGIIVSALLIGRPRQLLIAAVLWTLFRAPFMAVLSFAKYGDEFFKALLFAIVASWVCFRREFRISREFKIFLPALLAPLVSFVVRGGGIDAVQTLPDYYLTYLSYIVYFIVARQVLSIADITAIIRFFVVYMLFQYVCNVGYILGINPIPQSFVRLRADLATGTLGSGTYVAYFCLLAVFLLLALYDNKAVKKKIAWIVFILITAHNFVLTNTGHAFFLLILCFGYSAFVLIKAKWIRAACLMGIVLLGVVFCAVQSLDVSTEEVGLRGIAANMKTQNIAEYGERFMNGAKVKVYNKAFVRGVRDPRRFLFGVGAGMGISDSAMRVSNPVAMDYLAEIYLTQEGGKELYGGSVVGTPVSGVSELMVELGLVGLCCYYFPFIYLLFRIQRFYRRRQYSPQQAVIAATLCPFVLLTLILSLLTTVFQFEYYFSTIWVLAALVWDPVSEAAGIPKPSLA